MGEDGSEAVFREIPVHQIDLDDHAFMLRRYPEPGKNLIEDIYVNGPTRSGSTEPHDITKKM